MNRSKEKIRIAFFDHTPFVGGAQLALVRHLNALNMDRFDPFIICLNAKMIEKRLNPERLGKIKIIEMPMPKLKTFNPLTLLRVVRTMFAIIKLLKEEKADQIVINTERSLYYSFLAIKVLKLPSVLILRDFEYSKFLLSLLGRIITHFICVSNSVREYYFQESKKNVSVIYVGTDIEEKLEKAEDQEVLKLRDEFSIKEDFIIGFIGRLVSWKGPLILPAIAEKLLQYPGLPSWRIVVVGEGIGQEGDVEAKLKDRVKKLEMEKYFTFAGFSDNMHVWYKILSAILHTAFKPEPFATVIVESLTAGVPVIGVNLGGNQEAIVNNVNGFLVNFEADEFVQRLTMMMKDHLTYNRLRGGAVESSVKFSEAKVTKEAEKVYLKAGGYEHD